MCGAPVIVTKQGAELGLQQVDRSGERTQSIANEKVKQKPSIIKAELETRGEKYSTHHSKLAISFLDLGLGGIGGDLKDLVQSVLFRLL